MSNNIYCTYITTYSGVKLPPLYIGSTSIEKINNGYHGSVSSKKYRSIWLSEIKENPHLFETQILTTHNTREEALEEEMRLQELHDVVNSELYINLSIANRKMIFYDHNDPEVRKKKSESQKKRFENPEEKKKFLENCNHPERIRKISEASKNRIVTDKTRKKQSESMKKRYESEESRKKASEGAKKGWTTERRKKHSESQKGKTRSEESRKKQSESTKGRKMSEEARKNNSEAQKKRYESEESRKKASEGAKNGWIKRRKKQSESMKKKI